MIFRMNIVRLIALALAFMVFGGGAMQTGKARPVADRVDINHANPAQLEALPGIGDAYAAAIVKNRPYKNKAQLLSKGVIPQATYSKIRDKIIAKQ
jgi:DNA uptake protein ComE-like DNA-binding protein